MLYVCIYWTTNDMKIMLKLGCSTFNQFSVELL